MENPGAKTPEGVRAIGGAGPAGMLGPGPVRHGGRGRGRESGPQRPARAAASEGRLPCSGAAGTWTRGSGPGAAGVPAGEDGLGFPRCTGRAPLTSQETGQRENVLRHHVLVTRRPRPPGARRAASRACDGAAGGRDESVAGEADPRGVGGDVSSSSAERRALVLYFFPRRVLLRACWCPGALEPSET